MDSKCAKIMGVLAVIGVGVFIGVFNQMRKYKTFIPAPPPPVIKYKEPFTPPLMSGPADASLENLRKPYALLDLPTLGTNSPSQVNSQNCRAIDFYRHLEKSNYGQMTNNFKHEYPDSCSAPFQEVVLGIYQPEVLSQPSQ